MRYAVLLSTLGLLLAILGILSGSWGWLLYWLALDFVILGIAHGGGWHGIFGKRGDGRLPFWSWVVFLPLHAYTAAIWHLSRILSRERPVDQITDGIFVGRRLLSGELKQPCDTHVDLTAEFQEPAEFRRSAGYLAFPILDASAPEPGPLEEVVQRIGNGRVFIHCAQGHGRTGLFTLALLLSKGLIRSPEEGLELLQRVRPGIRLNARQMACIRAYAAKHGPVEAPLKEVAQA